MLLIVVWCLFLFALVIGALWLLPWSLHITQTKDLRERVIEISARIRELRSELQELESDLDSMLLPTPQNGLPFASIDDRVLGVLKASPNLMTAPAIHSQMSDVKIESIRASLSRMLADNRVLRPQRGQYEEASQE